MKQATLCLLIKENSKEIPLAMNEFFFNKVVKPQSFAGICQATWNGKIEEKESPFEAIQREANEELGEEFFKNYPFSSLIPIRTTKTKSAKDGKEMLSCHWVGPIRKEELKLIKLHFGCSELVFLEAEDNVYPLTSGVDPKKNIVLFDDDFKILKEEVFPQIELIFR